MIVGIYCGSRSGGDPIYTSTAQSVGQSLALLGVEIVYGGGRVGLMGAVADAALSKGGRVSGIIPRLLVERETAHTGLTRLHVVENMHERKAKIAEIAEAFIALPGGAGTFEEIVEQWTWGQLGIHQKPCAFLNVKGYFDPIKSMIENMVSEGFIQRDHADMLTFSDDLGVLLERFKNYIPPPRKWT
ncbi:TIGR00730 family Rossman fold protein [Rhizobium miluonense]|jgi:uncharacterized protein (TIGR00730 family)|uniref:Cytokinin riboside 5'-monophosphate phosphoribohydrolase n=1 Tax=Rhizobium miluonense TaxID=411945 RepID=A0ABU1SX63_9HYPH|nr:TIGR00730 family Rossman fold protein [Rhizobium miluonense]MDR6903562.1 uncharacterized protein (TIGR00730 family) [Rhizobium miluonense]